MALMWCRHLLIGITIWTILVTAEAAASAGVRDVASGAELLAALQEANVGEGVNVTVSNHISLKGLPLPPDGIVVQGSVTLAGVGVGGNISQPVEIDLAHLAPIIQLPPGAHIWILNITLVNLAFRPSSELPPPSTDVSGMTLPVWAVGGDRSQTRVFIHDSALVVPYDEYLVLTHWSTETGDPTGHVDIFLEWERVLNATFPIASGELTSIGVFTWARMEGAGVELVDTKMMTTATHFTVSVNRSSLLQDLDPDHRNTPTSGGRNTPSWVVPVAVSVSVVSALSAGIAIAILFMRHRRRRGDAADSGATKRHPRGVSFTDARGSAPAGGAGPSPGDGPGAGLPVLGSTDGGGGRVRSSSGGGLDKRSASVTEARASLEDEFETCLEPGQVLARSTRSRASLVPAAPGPPPRLPTPQDGRSSRPASLARSPSDIMAPRSQRDGAAGMAGTGGTGIFMGSFDGQISSDSSSAFGGPRSGTPAGVGAPGLAAAWRQPLEELNEAVHALNAQVDDRQLVIHEVLGQGAYGTVYKGTWRNLAVAVKTITFQDRSCGSEKSQRRAIMEAAITSSISHSNVVSTYSYDIQPLMPAMPGSGGAGGGGLVVTTGSGSAVDWKLYIVQEYCNAGSLREALNAKGPFWDPVRRVARMPELVCLCIDIASGLSHIHSKNIVHGDLNPSNVLLQVDTTGSSANSLDSRPGSGNAPLDQGPVSGGTSMSGGWLGGGGSGGGGSGLVAKIADFGLSVKMPDNVSHVSNLRQGTPFYAAPEVVAHGKITKAADIYSYGVLLWESFHHKPPFKQHPSRGWVPRRGFPLFSKTCPLRFAQLAVACMSRDAALRPSVEQVLQGLREMQRSPEMLALATPPPAATGVAASMPTLDVRTALRRTSGRSGSDNIGSGGSGMYTGVGAGGGSTAGAAVPLALATLPIGVPRMASLTRAASAGFATPHATPPHSAAPPVGSCGASAGAVPLTPRAAAAAAVLSPPPQPPPTLRDSPSPGMPAPVRVPVPALAAAPGLPTPPSMSAARPWAPGGGPSSPPALGMQQPQAVLVGLHKQASTASTYASAAATADPSTPRGDAASVRSAGGGDDDGGGGEGAATALTASACSTTSSGEGYFPTVDSADLMYGPGAGSYSEEEEEESDASSDGGLLPPMMEGEAEGEEEEEGGGEGGAHPHHGSGGSAAAAAQQQTR